MKINKSQKLFADALTYFPGGVNSPVRAWGSVGGEPRFIAGGTGSRIIDVDGNVYIDYLGSWGPLILGHSHPQVVKAIQEVAAKGTSYGAPNEGETELARRIQSAFPSMQMMRFVSSGTEAVMSAIRLSRAFTGRDKILKFEGGYHGHADFLLAKAGSGVATLGLPDSAGVPAAIAGTTLIAPYNDLNGVAEIFAGHPDEIAALIVEPVAGNMGVVIPQENFLQELREITRASGSLLIFDEVITGFRVAWGGAQALYRIQPDLTCLGKIIGGGLPVGVYGGNREIMKLVAPLGPMYQAGTLSGNPLAMAAGITTLDEIAKIPQAYEQLEMRARQLEKGFLEAAREAKIPIMINRVGSMLTVFFTAERVRDYKSAKTSDTKRFAHFFHRMLERGIYLPPSQFEALFVSLAHADQDLARTVEMAAEAFRGMGI